MELSTASRPRDAATASKQRVPLPAPQGVIAKVVGDVSSFSTKMQTQLEEVRRDHVTVALPVEITYPSPPPDGLLPQLPSLLPSLPQLLPPPPPQLPPLPSSPLPQAPPPPLPPLPQPPLSSLLSPPSQPLSSCIELDTYYSTSPYVAEDTGPDRVVVGLNYTHHVIPPPTETHVQYL